MQGSERGSVFEGIRTIAAFYLRADSSAICECIQNFGLNDLLFSVARLELSFKKTLRVGQPPPPSLPAASHIHTHPPCHSLCRMHLMDLKH